MRLKISFVFIALCTLKASQLALSMEEVVGLGKDVVPQMIRHDSPLGAKMNAPMSGCSGLDQSSQTALTSSHPELASANQGKSPCSQIKELRNSIEIHGHRHLEDVTQNLEQLHNYLTPVGETKPPPAFQEPQNLVEPLFEYKYKTLGWNQNFLKVLPGSRGTRQLASTTTPLEGITQVVLIWKYLQETFINLKCQDLVDPEIKLKFLKSLFLLGDYIHENSLLPQAEIKQIKIFQPETVVNLFNFHFNLLIRSKGNEFFGSPEWVNPELELLLSNPYLKHFHRSILDESQYFLKKAEEIKYPEWFDGVQIRDLLFHDPIVNHEHPKLKLDSYQFLTLYTISKFVDSHLPHLVPELDKSQEAVLLDKQGQYISSLLKLLPSRFKDPRLQAVLKQKEDLIKIHASQLHKQKKTKDWIKTVKKLIHKASN
ncbi:uncharacterized protein PGTG_13206 [Puccinia graminis f. sp. tritici CRL 75-36-700-3]|uniref:Uncharacterized protein n=1 Tax=Puccinia graminis f. sp. tritici (strain CRL 75-36-700-3 / race SCCL) TaxID=418459 RepID=E3KR99_PUCGT|nr:uncharacterized protein PGTG_13206 [Puccinia graminis f. sp. tritici CRL 75-36-700-3]EFP86824.2 hypothetical protein PGTG_13206 [Puccinia graminis f. sp. tritici CRL 75-36-700-3]